MSTATVPIPHGAVVIREHQKRPGGWMRKIARLQNELDQLAQGKGAVPQWRLDEVTKARREAERRVEVLEERVEVLEEALAEVQRRVKERYV